LKEQIFDRGNTATPAMLCELVDALETEMSLTRLNSESERIIAVTSDNYVKDECGVLLMKVMNYDKNFYAVVERGKDIFGELAGSEEGYDFVDEAILAELKRSGYQVEVISSNFGLYQV